MFQRSNVAITGGTFIQHKIRSHTGRSAFEKLHKASAPNALYNSSARFDPPKCHQNTRLAVLERIMQWIYGSGNPDALILWLYGPAGSGKSAILQTIAEQCDALGILLASFFFFRADATRNHATPLVPTIAYQIATRIPHIKSSLEAAIEHDPMIFEKSLDAQIRSLIVEPLKDLVASGFFGDRHSSPRLIIIDGLDECADPDIRRLILRAFARALREHRIPIILLISSRPEQDITVSFNSPHLRGLWVPLVLDDSFMPNDDIRLFLEDSFEDIKTTHPRHAIIPEDWPGKRVIDALVKKSSGQFIYASVAMKYISAMYDLPTRQLEIVLGLRPPRRDAPFAELDALYMHLLSSITAPSDVLDILAMTILDHDLFINVNGTMNIARLLELEDGDVELALAPLSSIITVGPRSIWYPGNLEIILSHALFVDFLRDKSRSLQFYINMGDYYNQFASQSIKYLNLQANADHDDGQHNQTGVESILVENMLHLLVKLLPRVYLTESLYQQLYDIALHRLWSTFPSLRSTEIPALLYRFFRISHYANFNNNVKYLQLHRHHVRYLEPVLRTEIAKYFSEPSLTALMVVCWIIYREDHPASKMWRSIADWQQIATLLQLDEKAVEMDRRGSFNFLGQQASCSGIMTDFLFHPTTHRHFSLGNGHYNQTALRILAYLCAPRRRVHFFQHSCYTLKLASTSRRRRAEKHQRGVSKYLSKEDKELIPCQLGLNLLLVVLKNCSGSKELATFIRLHIRRIAIVPGLTRRVLDAISEHLARGDSAAEVEYVPFPDGDFRKLRWLDNSRYL